MIDTIYIAGKNDIACNVLSYLKNSYSHLSIFAIVNRSDSGVHGWQRSFRLWATGLGVPVVPVEHAYVNSKSMFISLEFDQIIKPEFFASPLLLNVHFSLLPAYKGMYTSALPLLHGKISTGVSLHVIDAGIDTGPIISFREVEIDPSMTCDQLYFRLMEEGQSLVLESLPELISGKFQVVPQSPVGSSYYSRYALDYSNLSLDFSCAGEQLINQIRAYTFRAYQLPKVFGSPVVRASLSDQRSRLKPGKLVQSDDTVRIISTIDFDVVCHIDRLQDVLNLCCSASWSEVQGLLNNLVSVNDREILRGWSPLIVAAYHCNYSVLCGLLEAGANPNLPNFRGTSPLMYAKDGALKYGDRRCFVHLLEAGADLLACDFMHKNIYNYTSADEQKFMGL